MLLQENDEDSDDNDDDDFDPRKPRSGVQINLFFKELALNLTIDISGTSE